MRTESAYIDHLLLALAQVRTALSATDDAARRRVLERIRRDVESALRDASAGRCAWPQPWGGCR